MTDTQITRRDQIGPEYKRRYLARATELGVHMLPWDEFWTISEWAKNEHRKFVEMNKKEEEKEKQQEQRVNRAIKEGKRIIADVDRLCRDCGKQLSKKPGRGRWPVKCPPCKEK